MGNLKLINGIWKFKAIGYDLNGDLMTGWGSLTDRHNTTFTALNEEDINTRLEIDMRVSSYVPFLTRQELQ